MINLREILDKLYLNKEAESLIVLLEKQNLFDPFIRLGSCLTKH